MTAQCNNSRRVKKHCKSPNDHIPNDLSLSNISPPAKQNGGGNHLPENTQAVRKGAKCKIGKNAKIRRA